MLSTLGCKRVVCNVLILHMRCRRSRAADVLKAKPEVIAYSWASARLH